MKRVSLIAALILAALGGIYFGLFSCGGYAAHRQIVCGLLAVATLIAVILPLQRASPVVSRVGVIAGVAATFIFCEALAAPFYLSQPESLSEFMRVFLSTIGRGPC